MGIFLQKSMRFVDIFVIGYLTVVGFRVIDFNNTVCNGVHQFLVVGSEKHTTAVMAQTVIERGD